MQLALEFYGPIHLLYSIYDGAEDHESVSTLLNGHIDRFIAKIESEFPQSKRMTLKASEGRHTAKPDTEAQR